MSLGSLSYTNNTDGRVIGKVELSHALQGTRATNCLLVSASGLALAASFPSLNLDLLAWVAFIPLFWVIEDQPYLRVFLYAWLQGSVFAVVSLGWFIHFFRDFAGFGFLAAAGCLLSLALVLSHCMELWRSLLASACRAVSESRYFLQCLSDGWRPNGSALIGHWGAYL